MCRVWSLSPAPKRETHPRRCVFSFWKIKIVMTRVEGGAASGNERFALRGIGKSLLVGQSRQLIIAERGAPPKARLLAKPKKMQAFSVTCSKKRNAPKAVRFLYTFIPFVKNIRQSLRAVAPFPVQATISTFQ